MADFELAYTHTSNKEGGYVNDPSDYGRETYRGISRRWHPYWEGWKIVDEEKARTLLRDLTKCLHQREDLQRLVKQLYHVKFWNINHLDLVQDQVLAECIFDTGFHLGPKDAVLILQRALNVTNAQQRYYPDLMRDGDLGPVTLRAISRHPYPAILLSVFNILRGYYFVQRMEKDPSQEKFIGWFNRLRWNQ